MNNKSKLNHTSKLNENVNLENTEFNKVGVVYNNFNVNLNLNFVGYEKETNLNNISPDELTKKINKDLKLINNNANTYNYYNINYHLNSFQNNNLEVQKNQQSNYSEEVSNSLFNFNFLDSFYRY